MLTCYFGGIKIFVEFMGCCVNVSVKFPKGKSFDYYVLKEKVLKICFNVSMLIRWYLDFCFCRALPPWLSVGD